MPGSSKPQRWHEIEEAYRVLMIAEPGAAQTFEAQARARRIKACSHHAVFIRIEKIDSNFDQAFEVGTAAQFADWFVSTDIAWFVIDTVDEAQLETPRALAECRADLQDALPCGTGPRAHLDHQP